mgnify:CR=1 FL=1
MRQRIRPLVRAIATWLLFGVILAIIIAVAAEWFIEVARDKGLFENAGANWDRVVSAVTTFVTSAWVLYPLAGLSGLVGGLWVDHLLRRSEQQAGKPESTFEEAFERAASTPPPLTPPPASSARNAGLGQYDPLRQNAPDYAMWRSLSKAKIGELAAVCAGDDPGLSMLSSRAKPYKQHIINGVNEGAVGRVGGTQRIQTRAIMYEGDPGAWTSISTPVSDSSEVYVDEVRRYFAEMGVKTDLFVDD